MTNEKCMLASKRQLDNWVKRVDRLEGCVLVRTAKCVKGGGRRVRHHQYDIALYKWFCAKRAQNEPVSTRLLNDEAQ